MDTLESRGVRLRAFSRADASVYRSFVNDPEIARRIDRPGPVSASEHEAWFESLVASESAAPFAVEEKSSGRFLGLVWLFGIDRRHGRAEVRIVLGEGRGRGAGVEALRLISQHAFATLGLGKLWADVLAFNAPAARAFEKAGFVREGLLREDRISVSGSERVDVIRFGRLASHPGREA